MMSVTCGAVVVGGADVATRVSDRIGKRFIFIASSQMVGIIGFIIAMSTMNIAARYVSLYVQPPPSRLTFVCLTL
jgi:hypothetical protein